MKVLTEEEIQLRKAKARERAKRWYIEHQDRVKQYRKDNKEKLARKCKEWREKNTDHRRKYDLERSKSPIGRASNLVNAYNNMDIKANRGKGNLSAKWVVENIFSKPCAHCGKEGWQVIGCNRIDNTRPHTKDNVEPCCFECNVKLACDENIKPVYQYTLSGELVRIWNSTMECGRNGYHQGNIVSCCNGRYNTSQGYRWSYTPL